MNELNIFALSVLTGMIIGAPIGVTGALVADAALSHSRNRLFAIILCAATGDAVLASLSTIFLPTMKMLLEGYRKEGLLTVGLLFVAIGGGMAAITCKTHMGIVGKEKIINPSAKWLMANAAPAITAFMTAIIHPGNIAAFITVIAVLTIKAPSFVTHKFIFVAGIFIGSLLSFSTAGFTFWKIRQKADKFVHYLRYAIALVIILSGLYFILDNI